MHEAMTLARLEEAKVKLLWEFQRGAYSRPASTPLSCSGPEISSPNNAATKSSYITGSSNLIAIRKLIP